MEEIKDKQSTKLGKNKKLFIIISLVIIVLALGGIITAFLLNYNVYAPSNLKVLDDGNNVYICTDMNDNYSSYRFTFVSNSKEIVIDSQNNMLSINELEEYGVEIGQTYQITVQYIAQNEGNNSQVSESLTWKSYKYLTAPQLSYNVLNDRIEWNAISGADYYKVFINGLEPITTTQTFIDLQTIEGGERVFYVIAISNNENYKSSISNEINQVVVHKYLPFENATFDIDSKLIVITGKELLEKINVYIDNKQYECENFETNFNDGIYTYTIDISLFYQDNNSVGVSPITKNIYNVYEGEITLCQIL